MGSRWARALPLCCLVGLFFIDTVNGSAEVTASRRNGAPSSPQDNRLRRIPAAKKNHYRINVKTGSFEVVDGDNDDTELARAQRRGGDVVTVTGSMEVVDGARNGTKICFSGDGYAYCKSDRDGQRSSNPDVRGGQNSKFGRQLPRRWPGQRNNTLPKKSLQELAEEAANRTANVPKKSLKELAEEAGNRTANGSDRLKNTSPRQNSVPSSQNIQSSKRSLEELQKLAKEAANRTPSVPKKSLQELAEEAANRTANVPKKSLKELAEEAGNRTANGSDRLKNTSPRQNSVPSSQNIQSSKRSLEELQKLAKEAANRTPSVPKKSLQELAEEAANRTANVNVVRPSSRIRKIRKNIPKKSLKELAEEAGNRTANGSKRSLEELQKLAKEVANRTPSVNSVRPSSRIRKIRKNIPKKTLQDVMEEAANRTANDITTGIPSNGGVNHATPAPAHNVQLPRSWRTLEDLFVNSRKPRSTSELSTGSWAIVSGNNTATVTSVSGFENQIRNNIKNN